MVRRGLFYSQAASSILLETHSLSAYSLFCAWLLGYSQSFPPVCALLPGNLYHDIIHQKSASRKVIHTFHDAFHQLSRRARPGWPRRRGPRQAGA